MKDASKYANEIAQRENDQAMEGVLKSGKTKVYKLTDQEQLAWRKVLLPVQKEMESRVGKDLIDAINKETAEKK